MCLRRVEYPKTCHWEGIEGYFTLLICIYIYIYICMNIYIYIVDGIYYASVFHMRPTHGLRPPKRIFHETGPEQRSRAVNRCIQLEIMVRIFFVLNMFRKNINYVHILVMMCFIVDN